MSEEVLIKKFTLEKKGRKYFAAKLNSLYKAKLLIDDLTKDLQVGSTHELEVEDLSVRSRYGTQLIFRAKQLTVENEPYIITPQSYNKLFNERAKELSGKWDRDTASWIFNNIVEDKAEELDYLYNSDHVTVEITALKGCYADTSNLEFMGYTIAKAYGRDSGADIGHDVALIEGEVTSGGSMKNWVTRAKEGSIFRLKVSKPLVAHLKEYEENRKLWSYRVVGESKSDKN